MKKMSKKFINLDNTSYFFDEFKNDSIEDLVVKIKSEKHQRAREELYRRIDEPIKQLAKIFEKEYRSIENDWNEYYFGIIVATEKAIRWYDKEKGAFQNFWRKIVKYEKIRIIRNRKANKRIQNNSIYYLGTEKDEIADMMIYRFGETGDYTSFIDSLYLDELMEKVLDFIEEKYENRDYRMILLWLNYYSLDEIATVLKVEKKFVLSRLYTIINSVRRNLNCSDYV